MKKNDMPTILRSPLCYTLKTFVFAMVAIEFIFVAALDWTIFLFWNANILKYEYNSEDS